METQEEKDNKNRMMRMFAMELQDEFPTMEVKTEIRGIDRGSFISVRHEQEGHNMTAFIEREVKSTSSWYSARRTVPRAVRVSFSSSVVDYKRQGQFNRGFRGKRLQADIDSLDFKKEDVYKAIRRLIQLFNEELDYYKARIRRNEELKSKATLFKEMVEEGSGMEFSLSSTDKEVVTADKIEVSASWDENEIHLQLTSVPKDKAFRILKMLQE
jgi:hypothetical protein